MKRKTFRKGRPWHDRHEMARKARLITYDRNAKFKPGDRPLSPLRQEDTKIANRIDGYDRDDLGESPDY
jgi:hypothetical protein